MCLFLVPGAAGVPQEPSQTSQVCIFILSLLTPGDSRISSLAVTKPELFLSVSPKTRQEVQGLEAFFFFGLFCPSTWKKMRNADIEEEYFKCYFREINPTLTY